MRSLRHLAGLGLLSGAFSCSYPAVVPRAVADLEPCGTLRLASSRLIAGNDGRDLGYPGGLSLADVDEDDDLDMVVTRGYDVTAQPMAGQGSLLYVNNGRGGFRRIEAPFSTSATPDSGATIADIDADGDVDVFISVQRRLPDRFLRNHGRGRFAEESLGDATSDRSSNFSSSFVDIDGDEDLDLYVTGPTMERPGPSLAYRNDDGRFVAVTDSAILNGMNNPGASIWADLDRDGDPDLLVANSNIARRSSLDPAPVEHSMLYRNDGSWNFEIVPHQPFSGDDYPAMTAAVGDVDNDLDLDLFIGSYVLNEPPREDWLFLNDGSGNFSRAAQEFPAHRGQSSGAAFADLNGDGRLDLVTTSYDGPIEVFSGDGRGGFARGHPIEGPALVTGHSAIVSGDIDLDGDLDVLVGAWSARPGGDYVTVLKNETRRCGAWAQLLLIDRNGAVNPPGASVTLVSRSSHGVMRQFRESNAQSGFRSQSASFFLFSLPRGHVVETVLIAWPDGAIERAESLELNRTTRRHR